MQKEYKNKAMGERDANNKSPKVEGNTYTFPTYPEISVKAHSAQEAKQKLDKILKERGEK